MGLCEQCQSMTTRPLVYGRNSLFRHYHESLRKAVFESKCFICSRVWGNLSEEQKAIASGPAFEGIEYQISLSKDNHDEDEEPKEILATLSFEHGDDLYDCEDYNEVGGLMVDSVGSFAMLNPCLFPVHKAPTLSQYTNHPSCWRTVSKWIDKCYYEHGTCRESQQVQWMPTRLVDVSDYDNGHVRVVDSATIPQNSGELYLALSHCWGRKPFLVMDETNREDFARGVLVMSLAPNFQEAIFLTKQLGFRYIWIDSLCIMQRSEEDWDAEAPTMNKVYRNAFLTLGAMASPDGYGGLFRIRDPEMTNPCVFNLRTENDGDIECLLVNADLWESQVRQAPLSKRAWVVQERILAPRSLYFCENQLFWECRQHHACEVLPDRFPLDLISDIKDPEAVDSVSVKAFESILKRISKAGSDGDPCESDQVSSVSLHWQYERPYEVWNDILESYVKCALTNSRDKLVAISGIVKDFANATGDEYLAGLWRGNLINGLLWMARDERSLWSTPPPVRPDIYRAPSWSWASIDAPETRGQAAERNLVGNYVQVSDVHIEPRTADPTGELKHACLHLRGHLIKTRNTPRSQAVPPSFGTFIADLEEVEGSESYCVPLREQTINGEQYIRGLVLATYTEGMDKIWSSCDKCSGKDIYIRVGIFDSEQGDPLKYLGMQKPKDWEDWGDENDHLWFSQETPTSEFVII